MNSISPSFKSRYYCGIFLIAASTLLLEICLSKIFSIIHFHYFAFFIISTALFGYGLSGVLLSVSKPLKKIQPEKLLYVSSLLFGLSIVCSYRIVLSIPLRISELLSPQQILFLCIVYIVLMIPFLFSGLAIGALLASFGTRINKLYFLDLLGAGIGCASIVLLIPELGGSGTILAASIIALLAALAFSSSWRQRILPAIIIAFVLSAIPSAQLYFPSAGQSEKRYFKQSLENHEIIYTDWSPAARIDVAVGGRNHRVIWIDGGTNQSLMFKNSGRITTQSSPIKIYRSVEIPFLLMKNPNVMIIGPGGGPEVASALGYDAKFITAVELDPVITKLVQGTFGKYLGHLYSNPRVRLVNEEGRSFIRRSKEKYDIIQQKNNSHPMAVASGALNLSETYLLTKEAFNEYLDHLTPDGFLAINRHGGIRLLNLGYEVLKDRGVSDPQSHMILIRENDLNQTFLLKNSGFNSAELAIIRNYCKELHYPILFDPLDWRNSKNVFSQLLHEESREDLLKTAPYELSAPKDNWPFIEHFYRLRTLFDRNMNARQFEPFWADANLWSFTLGEGRYSDLSLYVILFQAVLLSGVFIVWPLLRFKREGISTDGSGRLLLYYFCLGIGFILIEISFIQKYILFIGYPVYAVAVILFAILIAAGLGSYFSSLMKIGPQRMILLVVIALILLAAFQVFVIPKLFSKFISVSFPARVLLAIIFILPAGFFMGIPFPTALSWTSRHYPEFVPWAWGINGYATVIGSVLAVILALYFGFQAVLWISVVIYLIGYIAIRPLISGGERGL
jgi:predicted membrane-bound spermidine synthase